MKRTTIEDYVRKVRADIEAFKMKMEKIQSKFDFLMEIGAGVRPSAIKKNRSKIEAPSQKMPSNLYDEISAIYAPFPRELQHFSNKSTRIFEIPGNIEAVDSVPKPTQAIGDYCAKHNFMKEEYARKLGFRIDRSQSSSVNIGSGTKLITIGTINSAFTFRNEVQKYNLTCHILPNCIYDVILGKPFLKATRTFSDLAHRARRVVDKVTQGMSRLECLYLGDSAPKFLGLLNGVPAEALADSGSKVMVMDEDYAMYAGLPINYGSTHRTHLKFADESVAYTTGMTYGVIWEFGPGGESEGHRIDFHILKNAPASVILCDTFLFDTEAYSKYDCFLVDEDEEDEEAYFFAIDIDRRLADSEPDAKYLELDFRGEEEDRIANLATADQPAAWAQENARRAKWEQTAALDPQTTLNIPANSGPSKRSIWRFKLQLRKSHTVSNPASGP